MNTTRRRIDWEAARKRLRESQATLEKAMPPQRIEAVYRRRAAQLAERPVQAEAAATLPVLAFYLGVERYGVELTALVEVFPFSKCAPVPGAPPELLGVMNVRGQIRPVLDLARLLEMPEAENGPPGYVLLLRGQKNQVGLRVDRAEQVRQVSPEKLTPPGKADAASPYVKGLSPDAIILLNTEAILSRPILQEVSRL